MDRLLTLSPVKRRILGIVLADEIPDPRDIVLVSLADSCRLFDSILQPSELEAAESRIHQVARMDLIAHAMHRALGTLSSWGEWLGAPEEPVWSRAADAAGDG